MKIDMGDFYDVRAVGVGERAVSIIDRRGSEKLLEVRPAYNRHTDRHEPILVRGEFGELDSSGGAVIDGLVLRDVRSIDLHVDYEDVDHGFHSRILEIETVHGAQLRWTLFCEGRA